jgi:AraC-like DNA-binding protein
VDFRGKKDKGDIETTPTPFGVERNPGGLHKEVANTSSYNRNRCLSTIDIAVVLGFADACHFSKVFRRTLGATPSRYRADL